MNPVAFEIMGLSIRWYGIILSTGIMVGIFLAYNEAKRLGINPENIIDLALWCVPAAVVGARVYYVVLEWEYYNGDFMRMINIREGGLAIHGALIAAVLTGYIFSKVKNMNFWQNADIVAPSIIMGQAIGRWGNFVNGEAHGGPTNLPWGIMVDGMKVHPTFLYESLWNLGVFVILILFRRNKKANGEVFLLYGILYSLGRFWIEGLRTDSLYFMGLRAAQLISIATIVVFSIVFYIIRHKKAKDTIA